MSAQEGISLEIGKEYLSKGSDGFDLESLLKARDTFNILISKDPQNFLHYYYSALVYYNLTNIYETDRNRDNASESIETGIEKAKASIKLNENFSDSHRLLGDFYGRLIQYKGGISGALYGPLGKKELLKALKLDPRNARAYIGLGTWKLHTPRLFGGSIQESIQDFEKAVEISPDLYEAYAWLGIAYMKKDDFRKARSFLKKALEMSPRNKWIGAELNKIPSTVE